MALYTRESNPNDIDKLYTCMERLTLHQGLSILYQTMLLSFSFYQKQWHHEHDCKQLYVQYCMYFTSNASLKLKKKKYIKRWIDGNTSTIKLNIEIPHGPQFPVLLESKFQPNLFITVFDAVCASFCINEVFTLHNPYTHITAALVH